MPTDPAAPTLDEVRAFVHLARELHFGRAARRLGVGRSSLSEAIRRLEGKVGAVLFERSSRRVTLTRAGARLLPRARGVVAGVAALREVAPPPPSGPSGVLRLGVEANGFADLTGPILAAFRRRHPSTDLIIREFNGLAQAFFDAHLDVALTRSPVGDERLAVTVMAYEPRGVLVGAAHPLAGTEGASIAEFLDEPFVAMPPPIRAYWLADEDRGGDRARIGGEAFTLVETLHAVAHLGLVTTAGASIARSYPVTGIAFAGVRDLTPVPLGIAVRADDPRPEVAGFVAAARDVVQAADRSAPPTVRA